MMAKVIFSRKVGLPGYSSAGAVCELVWDASNMSESLSEQIASAYRQAEEAVAEQLARCLGDQAADFEAGQPAEPETPAPPPPPPQPAKAKAKPRPERADRADKPMPRIPSPRAGSPEPPTSARQIFAWAKKLEDSGYPGAVRLLGRFAREHDLPWKTTEWPDTAVGDCVGFVNRELAK